MFYNKVPSFLVTGAKFHFLEIISNATVIFLKKRYKAITPSVTHTFKHDTHINILIIIIIKIIITIIITIKIRGKKY